jgi:hypothetical protein
VGDYCSSRLIPTEDERSVSGVSSNEVNETIETEPAACLALRGAGNADEDLSAADERVASASERRAAMTERRRLDSQ